MKVGLALPVLDPDSGLTEYTTWCTRADNSAVSVIATGERVRHHLPDPWVLLGMAATRTSRTDLLIGVSLLAAHSPAVVARQSLTMQKLSQGRFRLGVGRGSRHGDLVTVGSQVMSVGAFTDRIGQVKQLLSGEPPLTPDLGVEPDSKVGPDLGDLAVPEIVAGVQGKSSVRSVSGYVDGLCPFSASGNISEIIAVNKFARDLWSEHGKEMPTMTWFVFATTLGTQGRKNLRKLVANYIRPLSREAAVGVARATWISSVDDLVELGKQMASCGTSEMVLVPTTASHQELEGFCEVAEKLVNV